MGTLVKYCVLSDLVLICMFIFAAIYNFVGTDEHRLRLDVGDAVNIICQSEGNILYSISEL